MAYTKLVNKRTMRRKMRVRSKIVQAAQRPRVVVFRSIKHIYAQLIDYKTGHTLASSSTLQVEQKGTKKEKALAIGRNLAVKAKECGVEAVVFDRGNYLYHGRVQAVAEGLREGGLII
jgi:large subunit ribosomal protein L18